MDENELQNALVRLYAYDQGDTSAGIWDEELRARCIKELHARTGPSELFPRVLVGRMVRDLWLSDEALDRGYGPEDAFEFIQWLDDRMR